MLVEQLKATNEDNYLAAIIKLGAQIMLLIMSLSYTMYQLLWFMVKFHMVKVLQQKQYYQAWNT